MPDNTDVLAAYIRADIAAAAAPPPERSPTTISVRINGVVATELTLPPRLGRSRFLRRAILFILLILALPASAAPATAGMSAAGAAREARAFLRPCHYKGVDQEGLCRINEYNFVNQYVRALAGDRSAQGSTMASFSRIDRDPVYDLGEPDNQVLACAWAGVILAETPRTDPGRALASGVEADQCRPLGPRSLALAILAATKLQHRLRTDPVHIAPDWAPAAPPP